MKEVLISEGFGCKIIQRGDKLFIQYDNGQSASWIVENEITVEEAKKVMLSEKDGYEVILEAQRREKPTRVDTDFF
jgi:c-di-GMP-binding flagellar brake protein YcgR